MLRHELLLGIIAIASMFLITGNGNTYADDDCKDIKYEDDPLEMPGSNHGDNSPSEDKFYDLIFDENATLCEVAECHDDHECKGELTGKKLKEFYQSIAFESGSEDQQSCLKHRGNLPDDGQKALQSYEVFGCAVENY